MIALPGTVRKDILKIEHDDNHCGVTAAQAINIGGMVAGILPPQRYVQRCRKCAEIKNVWRRRIRSYPNEMETWSRVHMDNANIINMGLFLILVNALSWWPEVVKIIDRKTTRINQILIYLFRNGVPKALVSDNQT